jgi:hypothetical protein
MEVLASRPGHCTGENFPWYAMHGRLSSFQTQKEKIKILQ